jgi:RHS repeat-associated protein
VTNWPGNKGFVGGTDDANTGLETLGDRLYAPDTGRFISADPLIDRSSPAGINGYAYASNDPATLSDAGGRRAIDPDLDYRTGEPKGDTGTKTSPILTTPPTVVHLSKHVLVRTDSPYYSKLSDAWEKARQLPESRTAVVLDAGGPTFVP